MRLDSSFARLVQGEASVNELAEPFDMSQPTISKHVKMLERAGNEKDRDRRSRQGLWRIRSRVTRSSMR